MKHLLDQLQRLDVLVLDDSRAMRELLKTVLRNLWIRSPRECADVAAALHEIQHRAPDMIIADWEMPAPNGLDFVRMLRAMPDARLRRTPVLMLTAHTETWRVNAARDAGVTEFLSKPITLGGLADRIVAMLEQPRSFVRGGAFNGPCRRRRVLPHHGRERRAGMAGAEPHFALPALGELRAAWRALRSGGATREAEARLFRAAHTLRGEGTSFGYPLVSGVAASLCRVLQRGHARHRAGWVSVEAHLITLGEILEGGVSAGGGATGQRLLIALRDSVAEATTALREAREPARLLAG